MSTELEDFIIEYKSSPTASLFHGSNAFYRGLMGNIGSGKSVACVMELFMRGKEQRAYNGVRKTRMGVVRNCYDDQTEILTEKRGFQFFKNVLPTDRVATLQGEKIKYERPNKISISPYKGEMIGFEAEGVDFLVTPDHQMWVSKLRTRKKIWDEYHMVHAEDIYNTKAYRVRRDGEWKGVKPNLSIEQVEWLGFWYADGSCGFYRPTPRVVLTQKKQHGIDYIHEICKKAKMPFTKNPRQEGGFNFLFKHTKKNKPVMDIVRKAGKSYQKSVPRSILNAPPEYHRAFIRGFAMGDGHTRKDSITQTLYTSSKQLSDDLQEMALKGGMVANIARRDRRGKKNKTGFGVAKHVSYIVTLLSPKKYRPLLFSQSYNRQKRGWYKKKYDGLVYCAEMPIPTVYVRRNGKAFWCNRTNPELISTTIKTWQEWVPESICHISYSIPISGHCIMPLSDGTTMDMEIIFLPLDEEKDVKKLKSIEFTMVWFNEASEILHTHVTMAGGRVSRFPSPRLGGSSFSGVIMDTNPPDEDSWWYNLAEVEKPETYQFWRQPPSVLKVPKKNKNDPQLYVANMGQTGLPPAENAENHNDKYEYWTRQCAGAKESWINVFLMGNYGNTMDGKPIYPDYNDDIHCAREELAPHRGLPLILGFDFGLTPTCVIAQQSMRGQLRVIDELVAGIPEKQRLNMDPDRYVEDMGVRKFARMIVKPYLQNRYPGMDWQSVGDPAGKTASDSNEISCLQELAAAGIHTEMARTNKFTPRREAVDGFLLRMVEGNPGFMLSPRCRILRKGFQGGYRYRQMRTQGGVNHSTEPEKNRFSHPHDGLQYIAMHAEGGGGATSGNQTAGSSGQALPVEGADASGWT